MADHHKTVVPQNAKITKAQKQANKDAAKMQQKMEEDTLEEHKPEQLQDMSWLKDHKDFDVGHVAKPTKITTQRQDEAKQRLRKNAELKARHTLRFAMKISETASDKEAMDKLKYAITQVMRLDPPFEPDELKQASEMMMKRTDMYYGALLCGDERMPGPPPPPTHTHSGARAPPLPRARCDASRFAKTPLPPNGQSLTRWPCVPPRCDHFGANGREGGKGT